MNELLPVMSVRAAAGVLGLTEETVCGFIRRGELRASALGTDRYGKPCPPYAIRRDDLFELLDARAIRQDQEAAPHQAATVECNGTTSRRRGPRRAVTKLVSPVGAT